MVTAYLMHGVLKRAAVMSNDDLYEKVVEVAEPAMERANLFREAMKTFVRVRTAKRLASLGASALIDGKVPRETGHELVRSTLILIVI